MSFQKTVQGDIAWGIPGEMGLAYFDGSYRAEPFQLSAVANGGPSVAPYFGRAVTRVDNVSVGDASTTGHFQTGQFGGTGAFLGLLGNPKASIAFAYIGSDSPGIEAGTMLEAMSDFPGMWVQLTSSANVGDAVAFLTSATDQSTAGTLKAAPLEVAPADHTLIPGSRIVRFDVNAGLALVALTQLPTPAVSA